MRNGLILAAIAFAVALAVIVGNRLSNDALAVVVGTVCGISASIPVSIALIIAASRNWGRADAEREDASPRYAAPPPVVVIAPPQQNPVAYPYANAPLYLPPTLDAVPAPGSPREFKIVGEE